MAIFHRFSTDYRYRSSLTIGFGYFSPIFNRLSLPELTDKYCIAGNIILGGKRRLSLSAWSYLLSSGWLLRAVAQLRVAVYPPRLRVAQLGSALAWPGSANFYCQMSQFVCFLNKMSQTFRSSSFGLRAKSAHRSKKGTECFSNVPKPTVLDAKNATAPKISLLPRAHSHQQRRRPARRRKPLTGTGRYVSSPAAPRSLLGLVCFRFFEPRFSENQDSEIN